MSTLKTKDRIETLAHNLENCPLKEAMRRFPDNVKLVIELSEGDYNSLIPEEFRDIEDLELNTRAGIKFHPIRK